MSITLVGLNHRTAPVEIREQLAFSREGVATALLLFRNQFPSSEAAIISTCNRVEMIVASPGPRPNANDIVAFIAQARDLPPQQFRHTLYELTDEQACRHFYRVASGMDSMVLGEAQIVSQVKQAYTLASEQGTTGRVLNRLFHHAFQVSKRIRTETSLGDGKVSIPSVAVDVAKRIFEDFSDKRTLVIGAGDMAQLVCQYLREVNARQFTVMSRTLGNARVLAEACGGSAAPFSDIEDHLVQADIVITATSCPKPIITRARLEAIQKLRGGRPIFLIDLAVPRNVEPAASEVGTAYVYDVDTLGQMVADTQSRRAGQLVSCEAILDQEIGAFEQWMALSRMGPLISQMYRDANDVRDAELYRLFRRCPGLSEEQKQHIAQAIERLTGKLVHPCVATLRQHSPMEVATAIAEAFRGMADTAHRD